MKIIVREKGSGKAIEAPQMEIRDAAGQIQMFPQPSSGKTDPAEASKDFFAYATEDAWHDMDEYFCYLDPGIYQVIVLADGYETAGFSKEITMIDQGLTHDCSKFVTEIQIPVVKA